ncbi:filamentous hemagglutinin family protein [Variovorax sp. ZS18.2.2]|uniref:filamentous hemagglutinin family protein n=1 Tax=Variovorax sp. ZS18.2.2 TaxID=2971255 RepID=UPI002151F32F|nr:filamentous hemagglutinin family protein [Variovorax sp. ZS18.2.2]MCR6476351.1 filamentous hemagglutinin family protein [Variovorax sp. ZS18.2.2]
MNPHTIRSRRSTAELRQAAAGGDLRLTPLARAVAVALAAIGAWGPAHAGQAFSPAWFASKGAAQASAAQTGRLPNGMPASNLTNPAQQQQQANAQLQRSIGNLNLAAQSIAAQQAAQAAAREAALRDPSSVPDGLADGGLRVDTNSLTAGWHNAQAPVQSQQPDGRTNVAIQQTGDRAILNWETFNVGRNTTVEFRQQADWAALNRVNDPQARPSQIQGQIKANGTVLIANRNGIVFSGSSQTDTRNLVAAAARISDAQFKTNGIHSAKTADSYAPSFTDAGGAVRVEAGARITTSTPTSVKQGGGYVLLMGQEVSNAGTITTPRGQAQMAAGDFFIVRPGQGTAANQASTTRGNEVSPQFNADSMAGHVVNTGLLLAPEGDITLAGRKVVQDGVALATTTVDTRGTIHLLNSASDKLGSVTVTQRALNAVLLDDKNGRTALDGQREAAIAESGKQNSLRTLAGATGAFDNLSLLNDRQDLSRIEIVTGGNVLFEGGSTTLATGGQLAVSAGQVGGRSTVADGARLDVSGAMGVQVAMSSNNVQINIQGNEQRDAPLNRDTTKLNNANVWIDRRKLVYVAAGVGGYDKERWYTAGGLLEVGGYLGLQGHGIGEWAAQGGSVTFGGGEVVTQAGSNINLSGGTLDVQTGVIRQSWLKGVDGRLYEVSNAPANVAYSGLYKGFEDAHERWGDKTTGYFYNPLIGPQSRLENGYTVGRDAGRLVVSTGAAVLEGDITATAYQGPRQTVKGDAALDGYAQSHNAAAQAAQLVLGSYTTGYNTDTGQGPLGDFRALAPTFQRIVFDDAQPQFGAGLSPDGPLPQDRKDTLYLSSKHLSSFGLGAITAVANESVTVDGGLAVSPGGSIELFATKVAVNADLSARSGAIVLGNAATPLMRSGLTPRLLPTPVAENPGEVVVAKDAKLDARGLWTNLQLDPANGLGLAYLDGGSVDIRSLGAVTLAAGTSIDVSSGGAVLVNGKTRGGRGGDVTLGADVVPGGSVAHGLLTIDGDIRGYGVNGGGTLKLISGGGIVIGGQVRSTGDVLNAGERAPFDLILLQDYQVRAGDLLPVDYTYRRTRARPGEALGAAPLLVAGDPALNVVLAADWTPPDATGVAGSTYILQAIVNGAPRDITVGQTGDGAVIETLPAGSTLIGIVSFTLQRFPLSYVVPANVFPDGIPVNPQNVTVVAGQAAPVDFTLASGSRVVAGSVFRQDVATRSNTSIDPSVLQSGFARYDLNGHLGVIVADNARLDVRMPVYRFTDGANTSATGSDPAAGLALWTPPVWTEDPVKGVLTQRGGASLTLQSTVGSGNASNAGGLIDIRPGTAIDVDPGQSITLLGRDVTVDGKLSAPGGTIAIDRPRSALPGTPGLIWIGDHAVLDVAARAATAQDVFGRTYGQVADGGTISIGGALDWDKTGEADAADAFIVIRSGALLDASGTRAVLDPSGSAPGRSPAPITVASNGGSIVLKSNHGLYLDGTLRAAAGGEGAAGGTLALALASPLYERATTRGDVLRHRELVLAQTQGDSPVAAAQTMADARGELLTGTARVGVDRIEAGGFGNLSVLVDGPLSFDGNVALGMSQSLRLYAGTYAHGETTPADSTVSLSAPYVRLAGTTRRASADTQIMPMAHWENGPSRQQGDGTFSVLADLVDLRGSFGFGTRADVNLGITSYGVDRRGFEAVELTSRGDLRLLGASLATPGDVHLAAAQIYPGTGTVNTITAGYALTGGVFRSYVPGSVLSIRRYGEGEVAMPYSAFGTINLQAETVEQGGIVRAPLGRLTLGTETDPFTAATNRVTLLPGSITSVSGEGLLMPYGGTVDGLSYLYNGQPVVLKGVGDLEGGIKVATRHLDAQAGSVLDLSGGGTLAGAGFVSGRGGSVDVLATALANANPANGFSRAGNAVYAIVPGSAASYAPVAPEAGFGTPGIGQQITVPAGVPGLPAGTYTLMPSSYSLLPGAFRVEIGAADRIGLSGVTSVGNGSYVAGGYLGVANTSIREALPNQVVITPGDKARSYSSYNETDYNAFVQADAARRGFLRAALTSDAKTLDIMLSRPPVGEADRTALKFDGELRLGAQPASVGFGGTVNVRNLAEVLAAGQAADEALAGASVHDSELNKLGTSRLVLNGTLGTTYGQRGRIVNIAGAGSLIVRSGANLSAGELILVGAPSPIADGRITIEEGASLGTIGRGTASYGSNDGYVFTGTGVVALSNGWFNLVLAQPSAAQGPGTVAIDIGSCVSAACNGATRLVSEGTLAIATGGALTLADNVSYGTRNLSLALAAVNLGEDANIAAARAGGQLPSGLVLNQAKLDSLLAGNTATGAPALETLTLNARDAVNTYGAVKLDASSLDRLVLGTPAIYGYGAAGDVVAIRAGEFVWTGAEGAPGAAVTGLPGGGTLDIAARSIVLGHGPYAQANGTQTDARLALGFADVKLTASERVTSDSSSTLAVYQRQGAYTPGEGYAYEGGNLAITSPLLTGQAGSKTRITAGGAIKVAAPEGASTATTATSNDALGATLELKGKSIGLEGSIVLPSGRLVLAATDGIALGAGSRIDLSGRKVALFDVDKYSWGGDLVLTSAAGSIAQAAGSVIDVSARNNRGGTVEATALGEGAGAGRVDLLGAIRGSSSGSYDAGGTVVPYDAGELTVRAQTLGDFADLNHRLNEGGVFGARRFQVKQGDLVVGDGVKAREVSIAVDGGSLRVDGRIDASGFQVGSIRLAAKGDLTVNGTLDAHGTGLRVDSYGKIIDSPNRAIVDLTSAEGMLTLGSGARIDLRAGTDVAVGAKAGQNDGRARGTLDLNAPRVGADDVAVTVNGTPVVQGAKTVAVNAFRSYDDAPLADLPDVSGYRPQLITQGYLDRIDGDSQLFINAALGNGALANRLSGLGSYHLRPGVEIVSDRMNNPHGDITVDGDLDLSGYRYGPGADRNDPARRGYGEPGKLVIRAAGGLNVHGSINDGFAPPPATPDDSGWVLTEAHYPALPAFGGDIVVPIDNVVLDTGTVFPAGSTLNYSVNVAAMTLPAGTVLPVDAVLTGALNLSAGTVVAANIYNADGSLAYAAGTVLRTATALGEGMRLGAGTALRVPAGVAALTWPKGVALPVEMNTTGQTVLARGSLIPSLTTIELPGDQPINLRPSVNGVQGRNWAVAPMLGEGATSWNVQLVAGADLGSADRRALNPASTAALRLGDTHGIRDYIIGRSTVITWGPNAHEMGDYVEGEVVPESESWVCVFDPSYCVETSGPPSITGSQVVAPAFSVLRTGTGDLELLAAGDIRMDSLYGVYTAGAATAADAAYNRPRGKDASGSPIGPQSELLDYSAGLATYRAWYPDQGGNVLVAAGGNLVGDLMGSGLSSVLPGNWLWRQGSGTAAIDEAIPTAWWINFGAYTATAPGTDRKAPDLTGFTGIGTLGGGDIRIRVGGEAGTIGLRGTQTSVQNATDRSEGLVVAVGSTGRVGADGTLTLTGGGDIDMRVAGALNPNRNLSPGSEKLPLTGAIANLRGATGVSAASIGSLGLQYLSGAFLFSDPVDARGMDPFAASYANARGGINLVPGDTAIYLQTRGDLVLGGASDPGRSDMPNSSAFSVGGQSPNAGGQGWFSLWTGRSAINLISAGGQLTPTMAAGDNSQLRTTSKDAWIVYPSIFRAAALTGSLYYGYAALPLTVGDPGKINYGLTLAPSATGELEMLAGGSIYAGQYSVGMSGTGTPLPTPFNPAFVAQAYGIGKVLATNVASNGLAISGSGDATQFNGPTLFAFGPNTAAVGLDRVAEAPPVRFYAAGGDIIGLKTGEVIARSTTETWYNAAAPIRVMAGRDIVNTGVAPGDSTAAPQELGGNLRGNLIVHGNPTDVSIVSAGRDIRYANFDIAGPGTLEVTAGRNLLQEDRGGITSIGPIVPGDTRPGASIAMAAGVGAAAGISGLDMSAIRTRYLDPSMRADAGTSLASQPGKAVKTYEAELAAWLNTRYGFSGDTAQALAYFDALAPEQQRVFLREVYYAELRAGGREYNDPQSSRSGSYLRGREMISTLFPEKDAAGNPIARGGDITMFGGSGVRTNFGGDIEMLAPGGQIILGVQGAVPPATSGVMTQGEGDIRLFSDGSLLLGLSRIMTTFGGDIFAWSVKGDINAGRGSKTTVLYTPPKRVYDAVGNVEVSPQAPSSGAGIATLAPIAEVPPGDVDLIAPLGTIDAGEAGIRVSGNVNVAALQVVNAANIQVKGESSGLPVIASVNVGALTNASAAASQASMAAQDVMQRDRAAARQALPSVFTVRVLGFGNEPAGGGNSSSNNNGSNNDVPADKALTPVSYNPRSVIRVLGASGSLPPSASRQLTDEERANLQR